MAVAPFPAGPPGAPPSTGHAPCACTGASLCAPAPPCPPILLLLLEALARQSFVPTAFQLVRELWAQGWSLPLTGPQQPPASPTPLPLCLPPALAEGTFLDVDRALLAPGLARGGALQGDDEKGGPAAPI